MVRTSEFQLLLNGLFVGTNTLIATCYFTISFLIFRGFIRGQQHLLANPLVVATAAIFFTGALGHSGHVIMAGTIGQPQIFTTVMGTQVGLDFLTAIAAGTYLTLRQQYSLSSEGSLRLTQTKDQLARANAELAKLNVELESQVADRTNQLLQTNQKLQVEIAEREAEMHRMLQKEKELGELKSRFVCMASHEFRTPLTTIMSSSELLEYYSHQWPQEKKMLHFQRIQTAAKQMTELLNDVMLIGSSDAGKLKFNPAPIELTQFCRDLVEEFQLINRDRHQITFVYTESQAQAEMNGKELPSPMPQMDEKLLRYILCNLLSNAIKYSPPGSPIHFKLARNDGLAVFQIQDWGIGIPTADRVKIFDSFHRGSNVGNIPGTGLGLAIAKKCVDLHNGKISIESEVGNTIFTVTLPLDNWILTDDQNSSH